MAELLDDLKLLIRTRHAIVTVRTLEEEYSARMVRQAGRELGLPVLEWSLGEGLRRTVPTADTIGGTGKLLTALKFMSSNESINVYVIREGLRHLGDAASQRALREVATAFTRDSRTVFMIDPSGDVPASLHPLTVPFEMPLPDADEIRKLVKSTFRELTRFGETDVDMTRGQFNQFLTNLRGLTRMEVSQVVADAVLGDGKLSAADVERAIEIKRQRLRQTGVLDYIPSPEDPPSVGGMSNLRKWLQRRSRAFTPEAKKYGLEPPKGILMLGVQGCGKSLMARYVAARWKMPLLRMDVGALYNKYVGETERHLRQAFSVCSSMAPCVLWIDEVEKAFASAGAGAEADGGLSKRMFGQLLTWMQDHEEVVFVVATANDISALPPELMRKGRFDEIFFVDLPDKDARGKIFEIHLSRRKRDASKFQPGKLAEAAEGFSGAEIEQAIVAAMYSAFAEGRELTGEDILQELSATEPLSVVMAEKVRELRAWAAGRCVSAD